MAAAYLFFWDRIGEFITAAGDLSDAREQRLLGLLQALRTALQVVVIELEDEDDPQVIFETLNARGQPLLPSDLIRNYIFMQAAGEAASDADELYEQHWRVSAAPSRAADGQSPGCWPVHPARETAGS
jgi:hypothetical protein